MASPIETQEYLEKFCDRNQIDKMKLSKFRNLIKIVSLFQGTTQTPMQNLDSEIASLSLNDTTCGNSMQPPIPFKSDASAGIGNRVAELRRIGA